MSFDKVANCLLIAFIALANGMPQEITTTTESPGPLPFLQFTNGGIRVNFGGYHAEAGLGGLLRGTGGGLHASAGTPWGAHAGAGLSGQLNGEDGNLGGGLYARAGLGRGRPEAAAGLGGRLDGRSFNPIAGGLYAGATSGGPGTGVYLGGGLGGAEIDGAAAGNAAAEANVNSRASGATTREVNATAEAATSVTKSKGHTNIQIIRSKEQKEKEVVALEAAALPADEPADGKVESQNKETRRAIVAAVEPAAAEIGLVGSVNLIGAAPVVKSVEKSIVASAPVIPVAPVVPVQETVAVNTIAVDKNPTVVVSKPVYPRWYFRKRFWTAPRKVVYAAPAVTVDSQSSPSDIVGGLYANAVGDSGTVAVGKVYTSGSLFNDIFNIPISTLSAVNQLLNNVG
ncbi:PE-PGRS family protein PE_PGRS18 isoform X2 [Cataglyphis hispanica]|uniref:PE-PGRS family protein PE_PGRS18 isoform X2 n=1 Tax=Cataglyphis hispanica TaxID=1086592 RepID=UPI0021804E77|nr:PE-PGRS family protein PE_PGRS18 isoform X2 [Cataglyphis hispanica]